MTTLIIILVIVLVVLYNQGKKNKDTTKEEVGATIEPEMNVAKRKQPVKRMNFPVVGLNYENRRKLLKGIIQRHKKEGLFMFELYEGYTNKQIIEDYLDKVYEITDSLSGCIIEKEDDNPYDENALRVMVSDVDGTYHHIGYVPREYCVEIRDLMESYRMLIGNTITGGKYKQVVYDDYGNEKVKVFDSEYGLNLSVSFWENQNEVSK